MKSEFGDFSQLLEKKSVQGWYAIFPGCGAKGDISVTSVKDKTQHKLCLYIDGHLFFVCFVLFSFCFLFCFVFVCLLFFFFFFVCLFVCFFFFTFSAVYSSVHPHRVKKC